MMILRNSCMSAMGSSRPPTRDPSHQRATDGIEGTLAGCTLRGLAPACENPIHRLRGRGRFKDWNEVVPRVGPYRPLPTRRQVSERVAARKLIRYNEYVPHGRISADVRGVKSRSLPRVAPKRVSHG